MSSECPLQKTIYSSFKLIIQQQTSLGVISALDWCGLGVGVRSDVVLSCLSDNPRHPPTLHVCLERKANMYVSLNCSWCYYYKNNDVYTYATARLLAVDVCERCIQCVGKYAEVWNCLLKQEINNIIRCIKADYCQ